jgi:hypothetical protein
MQNSVCIPDEGAPRLWHEESDNSSTAHDPSCTCRKQAPRIVTCISPGCGKKFKPTCHAHLFCCWDCFAQSSLQLDWEHYVEMYGHDPQKLREYISKVRYRQSEKGKNARAREYEKTYAKRRGSPPPVKNTESERIRGRLCKRPGCLNRFQQPPQSKIKRYCSINCRKTFRDVKDRLWAAYKETLCPRIWLVLSFLSLP